MRYLTFIFLIMVVHGANSQSFENDRIQPYVNNSFYWQYKQTPVLLLGGNLEKNIFQSADLEEKLTAIHETGGNFIVNMMSGSGEGDLWPYWRAGEKYKLDKFNTLYWNKFDKFLKLTAEREIVVQIEVWAVKDILSAWPKNPWNPMNNNQYTTDNTKLKSEDCTDTEGFPDFFKSVPALNNDSLVLLYQQRFVEKLLSISFNYNHVLYSSNIGLLSESATEWNIYWAQYIKLKANEAGVKIENNVLNPKNQDFDEMQLVAISSSKNFSDVAIPQKLIDVNQEHWEIMQNERLGILPEPKPINFSKIYGGPFGDWTDGPIHGIERFWRCIVGGAATVCFNSPPFGIGFSDQAQAHIKSARLLEDEYDFFTSTPDIKSVLLSERENDEAYLAKNLNNEIIVYFPDGGEVVLDFTDYTGVFILRWLNIEASEWIHPKSINGGGIEVLKTPAYGSWIALIQKEQK